jgi:hypothetical protein
VVYTDFLVDKFFDKDIIKMFGFGGDAGVRSISNKLAALI